LDRASVYGTDDLSPQALHSQEDTSDGQEARSARRSAQDEIRPDPLPSDPDLARIIAVWPELSHAVRAGIVAMAVIAQLLVDLPESERAEVIAELGAAERVGIARTLIARRGSGGGR